MEHLPEFISNHWLMCSAFVFVLVLIILNEWQQSLAAGNALEPHQAVNLMNRNDAVVIDIRSKEQFKNGHILNAQQVDAAKTDHLQRYKDKDLIIVCDSGTNANSLAGKLKGQGFDKVNILKGGMQAWQQAELPTTKK